MAFKKHTYWTLHCDHDGCTTFLIADTRKELVDDGKDDGWYYGQNMRGPFYCVEHYPYRVCEGCGARLRPWNRRREAFPEDTRAYGSGGLCTSCVGIERKGRTLTSEATLERAVDKYYDMRVPELRELIEMADQEALNSMARSALLKREAEDLMEVLAIAY